MKRLVFSLLASLISIYAFSDVADPQDPVTWQVTANDYQYSMTITTALVFDMEESRDVTDKIAAFSGNDCRGVAQPITYVPESDRYLAHLLVYSNNVSGDTITLYMHDESTNQLVEVAEKLIFAANATFGSTEDPYLSITTYDVVIRVMAGTDSVEGATVFLDGYGEQISNDHGRAVFNDVAPLDSIYYSVSEAGFDYYENSLALTDEDIVETANLTLTRSFSVTDGESPLQYALISLSAYGSKTTDMQGMASFSEITPSDSLFYSVSLDEYDLYTDSIAALPFGADTEDVVLNRTRYEVGFTITDSGQVVEGATILLDGYGSQVTNDEGIAVFEEVLPSDSIYYSITTPAYDFYENSLAVVDGNVEISIDIDLTAYDVYFSIIDGKIPIENARVSLEGYGIKTTDVYGRVAFQNVILDDDIAYSITHDDFYSYNSSLAVVDTAVSKKVTLTRKTFNAVFNVSDGTRAIENTRISIEIAEPDRVIDFDSAGIPNYFKTSGNSEWAIDNGESFQGIYSIKSGVVYDNQFSEVSFNRKVVTGKISFFAKVSSEEGNDHLVFYIDGKEKARWSGDVDWVHPTFEVEQGERTFKWVYQKDGSSSVESDCAWIDYIQFPAENMTRVSDSTDAEGKILFPNLLPYDSIYYEVSNVKYNYLDDSIKILSNNIEENINLDVDLTFSINKEFNSPFVDTDSVYLEGYGKQQLDENGFTVFEQVIPTDSLKYIVDCEDYDIDSGYVTALYIDTIYADINASRYDVTFSLNYNGNPIKGLSVYLGEVGTITSDRSGQATFPDVLPDTISFSVDHIDYLRKEGELILGQKDTTLTLEILPVYYLRFNVQSATNTGSVYVNDAEITLTSLERSATTSDFGEAEFDEITPNGNITYTIKAEGYYDTTGVVSVTNADVIKDVAMELIPKMKAANFISPNSDGHNDYWEIYNAERYDEFKVQIFSASGELIYETVNYSTNRWDGTVNGNEIPDGIYYYIMKSPHGDIVFKGIINLLK
ncbi:MAG: T9SS type B sorting domain-containing protein [Bacteroidetes bacterium]|jgi:gliding motility-associated-like protein|nr:T9SS type B sorting domain-containing protein [Bacteroidota bacterium]